MTDPTACPKCGTMLYAETREDSTNEYHSAERCRDVLHAKLEERTRERDEAARLLRLSLTGFHAEGVSEQIRAALERLRSHGK